MKFYNTSYSPTADASRPQFEVRGNAVYATSAHPNTAASKLLPWYEIRDNKLYTTAHNPEGHKATPMFEIRGNNVHTTMHNPGHTHLPVFHVR
jgi:hypothetical protein